MLDNIFLPLFGVFSSSHYLCVSCWWHFCRFAVHRQSRVRDTACVSCSRYTTQYNATHMHYERIHSRYLNRNYVACIRSKLLWSIFIEFINLFLLFILFFPSFFNLCNRNSYSNATMVWRMFYYIIDVMVSMQVSPVARI